MGCYGGRADPGRNSKAGQARKAAENKALRMRNEGYWREKVARYLDPFWQCRDYLELRRVEGREDWGMFFLKSLPKGSVVATGTTMGAFASTSGHSTAAHSTDEGVVTRRGVVTWEAWDDMSDEEKQRVKGVSSVVDGLGTTLNHGCNRHAQLCSAWGWNGAPFLCVKMGKKDEEALITWK